jgi:hypothetical protein
MIASRATTAMPMPNPPAMRIRRHNGLTSESPLSAQASARVMPEGLEGVKTEGALAECIVTWG